MRIGDVSPTMGPFSGSLSIGDQCVSGKALCVAITLGGNRVYLGGHSGVWRSDDGGDTWWHPEWMPAIPGGPAPPGALPLTNVYDLAIDPADPDVVLAATGRDGRIEPANGIYRSTDGAQTWTLMHRFVGMVNDTSITGMVGCLSVASGSPWTLYAAGETAVGRSADGGLTWTESVPTSNMAVYHVAAAPGDDGNRRVYAIGNKLAWYSLDGGITWQEDPGAPILGAAADGAGAGARSLSIHPTRETVVYVMKGDLTLWRGVYPDQPSAGPGSWSQLASPPIDTDRTDSGSTWVVPRPLASGQDGALRQRSPHRPRRDRGPDGPVGLEPGRGLPLPRRPTRSRVCRRRPRHPDQRRRRRRQSRWREDVGQCQAALNPQRRERRGQLRTGRPHGDHVRRRRQQRFLLRRRRRLLAHPGLPGGRQ